MSYQEDLSTDIADLLETLEGAAEDRPAMASVKAEAESLLRPYLTRFRRPLPRSTDKEGLQKYLQDMTVFQNQILPKVSSLVAGLTAAGDPWWKFGFGVQSRLKGKLKDMERSASAVMTSLQALANVGRTAIQEQRQKPEQQQQQPYGASAPPAGSSAEPDNIREIQEALMARGINIPVTGKLDTETRKALRFLEQQLEMMLKPVLKQRGWSISGRILRSDGTVMSAATLRELLDAADAVASR